MQNTLSKCRVAHEEFQRRSHPKIYLQNVDLKTAWAVFPIAPFYWQFVRESRSYQTWVTRTWKSAQSALPRQTPTRGQPKCESDRTQQQASMCNLPFEVEENWTYEQKKYASDNAVINLKKHVNILGSMWFLKWDTIIQDPEPSTEKCHVTVSSVHWTMEEHIAEW